ncbi:MAG: OsmC family protein [Sphingobacteriales bacterium]|nr:OsmC family protein [Sphingobacteriales bacterium]MBI3718732.1 OsmC family protein [Sphingobacteriales bacterium]
MKIAARVINSAGLHRVTVGTDGSAKEISIAPNAVGKGSSINGSELLMLALATCYCNDIYREAAKQDIPVDAVEVICESEFGWPGEAGKNIQYKVHITSSVSCDILEDLIKHTDTVAEIHNTLRKGATVTLLSNNTM